ncbi:hypothetical protein ACFX2I_044539 [Malus domestica]|uniref:uncharacterized protein LOC126632618 n=1 Tax=Malus sylvestris TaxID=3752 RepID=UPI0021ABCE82|nr:uncharacterized protein LOC126632618 [Malus sylvestris]
MGGYSKIKTMGTSSSRRSQNSRSIDFSDLQSFAETQISTPENPTSSKVQEKTNLDLQQEKKNNTTHDSSEEDGQIKGNGGERFGTHVVLKRNSSVSSSSAAASSGGLGLGFQSAVKGAFSSMKRSSSVSERYCRIHDQSATTTFMTSSIDGDEEDEDEDHQATRSIKKKHKGGKILKVCKRFFGM